jgi:hypothetical protein
MNCASDIERTAPYFASPSTSSRRSRSCWGEAAEQPECHQRTCRASPTSPKTRMAVFRVLIDEFGCGNSEQEHSQLYRDLRTELGMPTELDHYIEIVSEPSLAYVNLFSWLAARAPAEEYFLGADAYFESSVLSAFQNFAAAHLPRSGAVSESDGRWSTDPSTIVVSPTSTARSRTLQCTACTGHSEPRRTGAMAKRWVRDRLPRDRR